MAHEVDQSFQAVVRPEGSPTFFPHTRVEGSGVGEPFDDARRVRQFWRNGGQSELIRQCLWLTECRAGLGVGVKGKDFGAHISSLRPAGASV